jgi:hypothetical protein
MANGYRPTTHWTKIDTGLSCEASAADGVGEPENATMPRATAGTTTAGNTRMNDHRCVATTTCAAMNGSRLKNNA